jgi:hypothetical protein
MAHDRKQMSKWQRASVKLTNIRVDLDNLLEEFTPEEKKTEQYRQLFDSIQLIFKHTAEYYHPPKKQILKLINIKTLLITGLASTLLTLSDNLGAIIKYLLQLIGIGSP